MMAGPNAWTNRTIISHRALVWIGLISYPLYLWHWPLLAFANALAEYGHETALERNIRIGAVALSFALAWLTYRFLEWPIRFQFRISPILLAGGLAATLASGLFIQADEGIPSRYINANPKSQFLQYYEKLRKSGLSVAYREECNFVDWQTKSHKALSKDCTARGPAETWFLWGDSHAQALSLGLRSILPAGIGLAQVATSGCSASLVHIDKPSPGNACNMSNDFARAEIARLRPSLLILAQKQRHELTDWDSIASFAHSHGVQRVILVGPVPQWQPSLPNIIAEFYWDTHPAMASIGLNLSVMATDAKLSNRYQNDPNLTYISLISRLCTLEGCLARIPGEWPRDLITFDYGHLTPDASVYVARDVMKAYISPSHSSYSARQ